MNDIALPTASGNLITIRASSIADLFDCAFRWEGRQILGIRSPASRAMVLGTAVHAGTAAFDQARLDGKPIKPDEAAGIVVDKLRDPGEEVQETEDDMSLRDAETIGLTLHTRYCTEISPRYEFKAVELALQGLDIIVPEPNVTVRITGHLDRSRVSVRSGQKALRISDVKTGVRAATKDGRADVRGKGLQLGVYQILAEQELNQPIDPVGEIIGLGTAKSTPIGVSEIAGPKNQILPTGDQPSLIEIAATMLKSGHFPPNPKSTTCGPKYCARWDTCPYHE
jgi:hypothetical protein